MIELHGWITVRETDQATDSNEEIQLRQLGEIKSEMERLAWFHPVLAAQNGEYYLQFTVFTNHMRPFEDSEVFRFFQRVGEIARGSYGLLYLHDDEAAGELYNLFQVFALRRGRVEHFHDAYLSPLIPKTEDPWVAP